MNICTQNLLSKNKTRHSIINYYNIILFNKLINNHKKKNPNDKNKVKCWKVIKNRIYLIHRYVLTCLIASMSGLKVTGILRRPLCWMINSSGLGDGVIIDVGKLLIVVFIILRWWSFRPKPNKNMKI